MIKILKKQNGDTTIVLLVIVFLLLAIGAGVYVYRRNDNAKNNSSTDLTQVVRAYVPEQTIPKDWVSYSDKETGISFKHPKNVKVKKTVIDTKKDGESNVYSKNATQVTRFCLQPPEAAQWCPAIIEVFDQNVDDSAGQLAQYNDEQNTQERSDEKITYKNLQAYEILYDGGESRTYLIGKNDMTYAMDIPANEYLKDVDLTHDDILTIFESLQIN